MFKEILYKKLTVREAESLARRIAYDKTHKKGFTLDIETQEMEEQLTETLGTRVSIEKKENGGKITIDFFSQEDLNSILDLIKSNQKKSPTEMMEKHIAQNPVPPENKNIPDYIRGPGIAKISLDDIAAGKPPVDMEIENQVKSEPENLDDRSPEEIKKDENTEDDGLYSIKDFSI